MGVWGRGKVCHDGQVPDIYQSKCNDNVRYPSLWHIEYSISEAMWPRLFCSVNWNLLAIIMVNHYFQVYSRHQGLNLVDEMANKSLVVVNGNVRNNINGNCILLF